MNELERKYGPSWQLVADYLAAMPTGFLFKKMGQPDEADGNVTQIYDWDVFREAVNYDFESAEPTTCRYLAFLSMCYDAQFRDEEFTVAHHLDDQLGNAATDAGNTYADKRQSPSEDYLDFVYSVEREYYWAASIQHHCNYIAIEMVVAHVTDIHLMRDLW